MAVAVASRCPKCGAPRAEPACPKCGLLADRMDVFARDLDADVPDSVRAAWVMASGNWEDAAAHDTLFSLTAEHQTFAWTAARYREAGTPAAPATAPYRETAEGRPGAAAYLERIRKAAEATMIVSATAARERRRQPYRSSMFVLAMLGFMIVLGLVLAKNLQRTNSAGSPAAGSPQVR